MTTRRKMGPLRIALLGLLLALAGVAALIIGFFTIFPYFVLTVCAAKVFRPDLASVMTGLSAGFSVNPQEKSPFNLVHCLIFDGWISKDRLISLFDERIIQCRDTRSGKLKFERFRHAYTEFMGYTFWKPEKNFQLEEHIREYDYEDEETLRLPRPVCRETDLERIIGPLAAMPWGKDKSPWEFLLIHNYRSEDDEIGTVLVLRHHHTLIDGYGLVTWTRELFQCQCRIPIAVESRGRALLLPRLLAALRMPWDMARMYWDTQDGLTEWHVPSEGEKRRLTTVISAPIPCSSVKRIKNAKGVSYSAVLFAAVAGGIRRYCKGKGEMLIPPHIGVYAPLPMPNHPGGTNNHAVLMGMRWSMTPVTQTERLREMESVLRDVKSSTVPLIGSLLAEGLGVLPTCLRKAFLFRFYISGGSVGISCFPPTADKILFDGLPCRDIISCLGTFGQPSMAILITGANGSQHIVITADTRVFLYQELRQICSYVEDELGQMLKMC